jgi:hypothetical protein
VEVPGESGDPRVVPELLDCIVQLGLVAADEDDRAALCDDGRSGGQAHPAAAAGDDQLAPYKSI